MSELLTIAIDGPASSGKSTIAKLVAEKLDIAYVDTGAMYRGITYLLLENNISLQDDQAVIELLNKTEMTFIREGNTQDLLINGTVVQGALRSTEVTNQVSEVAAVAIIRQKLTQLQQDMAQEQSLVMDGRDIGTCVLPNATYKFYFNADVDVRAKRRFKENQAAGIRQTYDELREEIIARDELDMNREISPLIKATDAIEVDTSHLSIVEVVQKVLKLIDKKTN